MSAKLRIFRAPILATAFLLACSAARPLDARALSMTLPLSSQLINLGAAVLLLTSRCCHGGASFRSLTCLPYRAPHSAHRRRSWLYLRTACLYYSAALSVALKMLLLPWILTRLIGA
jgi:hypothetical protein